ncbi:MAG TPA: FtsX-like permease family protein [Thermoleophilaceae bacterium]|nr:FtsX-like permease family protein [Thermoleophilaceae bacterium]
MRSAVLAKSVTDLTRRRARTVFAVASLSLAVASLGIFAVQPIMDDLMEREVAENRLADLTVETRPLQLATADLVALERLPNVAALEPRSFYVTRMYVGARRERVLLIGVADFDRQQADIVRVVSGAAPDADGSALTEVQNARQGRFEGGAGDAARVIAADGSTQALRISGEGRNLEGAQTVAGDDKAVVLYTTPATVSRLSGQSGFSSLAFRLRDRSPLAVDRTVATVRHRLRASEPGFTGFADLPVVRAPGDWPGKEEFEDFGSLFFIVTALALLSGLVLIRSTMSTMIAEQTGEIATMRAIGGRRRQLTAVYLRTALLLGALGALVGVPLGILVANGMVAFFASGFFAIDAGFGVSWPWAAASAALGLVGPALAALPAIRRGVRRPIREALAYSGLSAAPVGALDRGLLRLRFLPRTAQIGLRSVGRRRRRSLATALIVALAVGNLLGIMALASGVTQVTHAEWDDRDWQITIGSGLRRPLDAEAERVIRSTPEVTALERVLVNDIQFEDHDAFLYGVAARTRFDYRLDEGRWHTPAEEAAAARVVVVERGMARAQDVAVGDRVELATGTGIARLRVIGIAANQQENGAVAFVPLATARAALGSPNGVNQMWITTTSSDEALIDRTTTRIEDALTARGYEVGSEITYVGERDNVAVNRVLTTSIAVLGFIVVAISMVGLVNAITTSVLERTREVGILRCIGARGRDVRRIFATEGLVLAALGWLVGIPLGYAVERVLVWLIRELIEVDVPVVYPVRHIVIAFAGTLLLALVVMALPLRRAVHLKPGDALRYA